MSTPWRMAQVVVATVASNRSVGGAGAPSASGPSRPRKDLRLVPIEHREARRDQDVELAQQPQVVAAGLPEADTRVDPHVGDTC